MAGGAACLKTKDLGYPYELWTTRFLAGHARERGPAEGHACLADLAQGTVCKILGRGRGEAAQKCDITWNSAIPTLPRRWPRCCAFATKIVLVRNTLDHSRPPCRRAPPPEIQKLPSFK